MSSDVRPRPISTVGRLRGEGDQKPLLGPREPRRRRIGSDPEHHCNLPWLKPLPRMEPKEFAVRPRKLVQRRPPNEVGDDLVLGCRVNPTWPLGLTLVVGSPLVGSASVVRDISGDAKDPGKLIVRRNLIKAPPDDHERLVDQVVQI